MNSERAKQIMESQGVDALVASSTENVYYVSKYWSLGQRLGCGVKAYAILPLEGETKIVAPLSEADLVLDSQTGKEDVGLYGKANFKIGEPEDPSEQMKSLLSLCEAAQPEADAETSLIKTLEEKGLHKKVIALDGSGLSPQLFDYLREKLPDAKILDGAELLRDIRLVKTKPEVELIQRATEITEKSMEDALEIVRTEIMEVDVAGMFAYSIAYDGGRVTQNLIGFGERSAFPNPIPALFEAKRGDLIRLTLGCTWNHYHSNVSRTAFIGSASSEVKKRWESVQNAQNAALEVVEPGVKISRVYKAAEAQLKAEGIKPYNTTFGHSLGIECNEKPWVSIDSEVELVEGMVINVDVPYLELGWGGIQLEDTVLVTSEGYQLMTKTERTLYLL